MKILWKKWKLLAEKSGNAQATVVFSLLFIIIITPCGLLMRLFKDTLAVKTRPHWKPIKENYGTRESMKEQ